MPTLNKLIIIIIIIIVIIIITMIIITATATTIIIIIITTTTIIIIIIIKISLRSGNTGDSLVSWREGSSLALVGNPSRDGVSIKILV